MIVIIGALLAAQQIGLSDGYTIVLGLVLIVGACFLVDQVH